MSDSQIAIFAYGLACGLLIAAVDMFAHPGLDHRLMVMVLASGAALAGLIGLTHAQRRTGP